MAEEKAKEGAVKKKYEFMEDLPGIGPATARAPSTTGDKKDGTRGVSSAGVECKFHSRLFQRAVV